MPIFFHLLGVWVNFRHCTFGRPSHIPPSTKTNCFMKMAAFFGDTRNSCAGPFLRGCGTGTKGQIQKPSSPTRIQICIKSLLSNIKPPPPLLPPPPGHHQKYEHLTEAIWRFYLFFKYIYFTSTKGKNTTHYRGDLAFF